MGRREQKHIANALTSLAKAQQAMSERLDNHDKVLESQAQEIAELQRKVLDLRNSAIRTDLNAGLSGVEAAKKYELSPGRISQIKNSWN